VFKKWLILKPAVFFQNLILGVKLTDAHNGFRALSRKALSEIKIKQDGMAHASEIVEQIKLKDLKYKEVPVTISYHEFGQGFISGLKILKDLLFGKINK
ncbi:MAG TPA: glycosyltransferase family 2 protein, partial [Patescibacteria group bacterium]|nr:glycosyltransferase family 2 protein [Patescibacteria group bacterium]